MYVNDDVMIIKMPIVNDLIQILCKKNKVEKVWYCRETRKVYIVVSW